MTSIRCSAAGVCFLRDGRCMRVLVCLDEVRVKSEEVGDGWARWTDMCASSRGIHTYIRVAQLPCWKCGHMPKPQGASKVLRNPQQAYVEFYPNHRTGEIIWPPFFHDRQGRGVQVLCMVRDIQNTNSNRQLYVPVYFR